MAACTTTYFFKFKSIIKRLTYQQSSWLLSIALSIGCITELSSQQTLTQQAPGSLVSGSFSSSGLSDIIIVEGLPTNTIVSLYKNQGSGQFTKSQIHQFTGSNFAHLAIGNFTGFSHPATDFAVQLNSSIGIFLNQDANPGTFDFHSSLALPSAPNFIAAGRLQNSTQIVSDIVVSCAGNPPSLQVYLSDNGPVFSLIPIPLSSIPSSVATGDVDGDSFDEIVVTYFNTNQVEIFKYNTGTNQFDSLGKYSVGLNPNAVALGSLQGTLFQDIVVTSVTNNTVSVLLNNGTTPVTFQPAVDYPVQDSPSSLVIADLNNNGFNDIAVANQAKSTVSVLINKPGAPGTFNPAINQNGNSGPVSITAGNFFNSSSIGLGVSNFTGGALTVFTPSTSP